MHVKDFVKTDPKGNLFRVTGDDGYYIAVAERFFEGIVPEEARPFDFVRMAKYTDADALRAELERPPVLSGRRVVLLTDRETKTKGDGLADLIPKTPDSCVLVFSGANYLPQKSLGAIEEVSAAKLGRYEVAAELEAFFPRGIEPRAARRLADAANGDMLRIERESVKLIAYAGDRKVCERDVAELVSTDTELAAYEFSNRLNRGDKSGAYEVYRNLREKGENPQYLLSVLIGQARRMLYGAISPMSDAALAKKLGGKEYAVKMARLNAKKQKPTRLLGNFKALTELEFQARNGSLGADTALRLAVETLLED